MLYVYKLLAVAHTCTIAKANIMWYSCSLGVYIQDTKGGEPHWFVLVTIRHRNIMKHKCGNNSGIDNKAHACMVPIPLTDEADLVQIQSYAQGHPGHSDWGLMWSLGCRRELATSWNWGMQMNTMQHVSPHWSSGQKAWSVLIVQAICHCYGHCTQWFLYALWFCHTMVPVRNECPP